MRSVSVVCSSILVSGACLACDHGDNGVNSSPSTPSASATQAELPPLELRDDTENLLLTWVDEDGNFHVVQKISEVPERGRNRVRVVATERSAGTGQWVYVADLAQKKPDGTYPVRTMKRSDWEEIGASKRHARLEALAPSAKPPEPPDLPSKATDGKVAAVIYGADWCQPCHAAEKLLKDLGVDVTKKNIEKSTAAHREMREKLARAHRGGASIPVIDIEGQILIGYSPSALKRAVRTARKAETL